MIERNWKKYNENLVKRGEWMRSKRRVSNRKGWIKVHVAYDIESKQIVDFEVTDESVQD